MPGDDCPNCGRPDEPSAVARLREVQDMVRFARLISPSPSMSIYVSDLERALGLIPATTARAHKLGMNDDG